LFEKDINNGKIMINTLSNEVNQNRYEINELNGKVENLNIEVETQKSNLVDATNKYYTSVSELENTMSFHQKIIKKLEDRALKEDLALDCLLFLSSLFFVNTNFISLPIRIIARFGGNEKKYIIQSITKILVMTSIIFFSRNYAIKMGIMGKVGFFTTYIYRFLEFTLTGN